ncbi:MAG: hypothetical protein R6X13_11760, partial [bacterium]
DRIALDTARLARVHKSVLGRLQGHTGVRTGQFSDCFVDPRHRDHEHPLTLERYLAEFKRAGLAAACVHLHFHKALFVARRPR